MAIIVFLFLVWFVIYLTNTNGDQELIRGISLIIGGFLIAGIVARGSILSLLVLVPILGIALIYLFIKGCERLYEFIEDQTINEDDTNLNWRQKLKIIERYRKSFTYRQKEYIKYIGFDIKKQDLGQFKELKEYFKKCDIEGNGNYWKGVINKKTGTRYQLKVRFHYYQQQELYKAYLKNWDQFNKFD